MGLPIRREWAIAVPAPVDDPVQLPLVPAEAEPEREAEEVPA